jgi:hypothetical protein
MRAMNMPTKVAEEAEDRRRQQVQDEDGRARDEDEHGEQQRQHHVGVGQPLDALLDAGDRGGHERHRQHRDDADQQSGADLVHPVELLDAGADLERAEAEGGRWRRWRASRR